MPIKQACKAIESKNTNLASCFLQLVQLAMEIRNLPDNFNQDFHQECILIFNKCWQQFDIKLYMLTYFLHLQYRG